MKSRSLLATLAIVAWSVSAVAAPVITVEKPSYDFGTITEGVKVDHVFVIKNTGDAPLSITSVRPSCGCTAANASAPVIQPGQTGDIKTSFNSTNFSGSIHKTISVDTNDPKAPSISLSMVGSVINEVQTTPKQLNYGQVKVGSTQTLPLTVENRSNRTLKLLAIKSPMPHVTYKAEKTTLKHGEITTIYVSVTPGEEERYLSGYLSITTDNRTKPEISIPIYGSLLR